MDELHFFEPEPRKKQNFAPCKNDVFCYDGIRPSGPVVFIVQLITSICRADKCAPHSRAEERRRRQPWAKWLSLK